MTNLQHQFNHLTPSPKTVSIPEGLEQRTLLALHAEQERSVFFWNRLRQFSVLALGGFSALSVILFVLNLTQSGFQVMADTAISNFNALPLNNALMALLETLPVGSLTLALGTITFFCILLSMPKPKISKHNFTLALHV
jgi:hypothetical protein